ncbi:stealth conserved region 3 domain-containing protein [Glutamicibacter nicotianae]|uniref:stealth conserved region 3 domain-containing protein n=1 Tax=Glutamicibacter nicotianae TaxID=37929 RepID=UPI00195888B6|nr:stealth conserved region 3 domain-containing protein [Glutamicibacter nicotianae]MBM7768255.1 glycosyltransferase involved in cell wall biosynthesis [Glutamicibacter nicotianae]
MTTADANAGTERAIQAQIENLDDSVHEIEVVSIYRQDGSAMQRFPQSTRIRYLINQDDKSDLAYELTLGRSVELANLPSNLIDAAWDNQFNALSDYSIRKYLSSLSNAVVMTTTPALAYLASLFVNSTVKIVAQEHRATSERGVGITPLLLAQDSLAAVVSLNEENNNWVRSRFDSKNIIFRVISNSISNDFAPKSLLDSKIIVAAGRLSAAKQFDHLIGAFSQISDEFPDWTLRIFGSGPDGTKLRNLISRGNLSSRIQILPAVETLNIEWAKASIHAMASRSEGQSLVILEAAASGVPTVAYDCPTGPRNLINDGVNGRLVELNSITGLSAALAELMRSDSLRSELGNNAQESTVPFLPISISTLWNDLLTDISSSSLSIGELETEVNSESESIDNNPTDLIEDSIASDPPVEAQFYQVESIDIELAKTENYQFVRALLESKDLEFFALEPYGYFRNSLAIREEDKSVLLEAFSEITSPNIAVRCEKGNARLTHLDWYPSRSAAPYQIADGNVFRVFNHYTDSLNTKVVGAVASTDIEVWEYDIDAKVYRAPRHNRLVDQILGDQFKIDGANKSPMLWSRIDFPIDVVYTWVDDTDPEWKERKNQHLPAEERLHPLATSEVRFRNRDELKYSIRSVRTFAPWVNKIYIVTDAQRPSWLIDNSDIEVIDHRELFPDSESTPTFNSHAIESVLHRIPGLSEHFLYLNDDVMFMRYQDPETFFHSNGIAKFFQSPVKIADLEDKTEPHMWAAINNRRILASLFGRNITQSMLHTPHAHRKSVLCEVEQKFSDIFATVRSNRFRASTDISLLSSFAQYYGYFTGKYLPGSIRYTYCAIGSSTSRQRFRELALEERFDVLALGESNEPELTSEDADAIVQSFFDVKFPMRSKDEKRW